MRVLKKLYSFNTVKIAVDDFRHLKNNTIAIVVIIGLIVVPPLYAWFNLAAMWNPYENTGNLKVAIVNNDVGYTGNLAPLEINVGEKLINGIKSNNDFSWVVTSEEKALDKVKSGKYYAAILIPENFSECMMSVVTSKPHQAKIKYYCNEKTNALTPTITKQGADALQNSIQENFCKEAVSISLKLVNNVSDLSKEDTNDVINNLQNNLSNIRTDMNTAAEELSALAGTLKSIETLTDVGVIQSYKGRIAEYKKVLDKYAEYLPAPVYDDIKKLDSVSNEIITNGKNGYAALCSELVSASIRLKNSSDDIQEINRRIDEARNSDDLALLQKILMQNEDTIASFFAQPVELKTTEVYPSSSYGTAMTPFFTCLSLWIGGTVMVALLKVELEKKRREKLVNFRYYQEYFGRGVLFGLIGLGQALLLLAGNLCFLEIDCKHPFYFILAGVIAGAVFVNMIYTFTASFGDVGKAICVLLLVMQVAGSGGTMPIEMMPKAFQIVYPLMPFVHAMTAMREAIYGLYGNTYWIELAKLGIYTAFSLVLGIVLRLPVIRLSRYFKSKLEETRVIG